MTYFCKRASPFWLNRFPGSDSIFFQDLIRNNIIDIINYSEINDLIAEGYINCKEDVIEVQKCGTLGQTHDHRNEGKYVSRP